MKERRVASGIPGLGMVLQGPSLALQTERIQDNA
jgi:hypothetical protein